MLYEIIPNYGYYKAPVKIIKNSDTENLFHEDLGITAIFSNSIIDITANTNEPIRWSIYDMYGNIVESGNNLHVSTYNLPKGAYIFVAASNTSTCKIKFLK